MAESGRYCCKSPFAPLIKNSPGRGRDFRVKIRGTSSPAGKLTVDLGNAIEATKIGDRRSDCPAAGKLSLGDFRLLQQYRPKAAVPGPRLERKRLQAYFARRIRCHSGLIFPARITLRHFAVSSAISFPKSADD